MADDAVRRQKKKRRCVTGLNWPIRVDTIDSSQRQIQFDEIVESADGLSGGVEQQKRARLELVGKAGFSGQPIKTRMH